MIPFLFIDQIIMRGHYSLYSKLPAMSSSRIQLKIEQLFPVKATYTSQILLVVDMSNT